MMSAQSKYMQHVKRYDIKRILNKIKLTIKRIQELEVKQ